MEMILLDTPDGAIAISTDSIAAIYEHYIEVCGGGTKCRIALKGSDVDYNITQSYSEVMSIINKMYYPKESSYE